MSECLMPNCRKYAPADEAMCAEHRDGGPLDYSALTLRLKTYHDDNSRLTAEIEQSQAIVKAAKELFRWHCMVEGGIVPDNAWTPLGNALFPGDPETTKDSVRVGKNAIGANDCIGSETDNELTASITGRLPGGFIVKIGGLPFTLAYPTLIDAPESSFRLAGIEKWTKEDFVTDKGTTYTDDDMSREAREWRASRGRICCNWHSYMKYFIQEFRRWRWL